MHYLLYLFVLLFLINKTIAKIDICGSGDIDLSALDSTEWELTHIRGTNQTVDYNIHICGPIKGSTHNECNNKQICRYDRNSNRAIGFEPKSVNVDSNSGSKSVDYEGPVCDQYPSANYSLTIRFTCGPHLEYPQHFMDTKCRTYLIWRTYAVCNPSEKSVQNEVKCYVYDKQGYRRDLTPLIRPKGGSYKVLSPDQDFYINVCSGVSSPCTDNTAGACLRTGDKFTNVGNFGSNILEFKGSSSAQKYEHIEMTYRAKTGDCYGSHLNYSSRTTIRFICPQIRQKRSIDFADRTPKLVSSLDCDYQIEWLTEYACPVKRIEVSANSCELREEVHGFDFDLKSHLKRNSNEFYKIENISIDINNTKNKSFFDINFNVCGGLGDSGCGSEKWSTIAVCLKSKDSTKSRVIGLTDEGSLRLADNKFMLTYRNKKSDCKFGNDSIPESTSIQFICDDSKGPDFVGKPEFVSFEDCTYSITWETSLVCPIVSPNTSCVTTFGKNTFDLSLLRKGFGSDPWIAGVSQSRPWSRHAKNQKDVIYVNVCGYLPKTPKTSKCDGRSSACMVFDDSDKTVNLGQFTSSPQYNEDIGAIVLIYDNGFDLTTNKTIKSKFTLRCKPRDLETEPILVDIDQELGIYYFEWETSAACPINAVLGNDCKVYDEFLDYTFDLSPLTSKTHYVMKTDGYEFLINVCDLVVSDKCNDKNVKNAVGPIGACQVEEEGDKRVFSLGKANQTLTYWNGVINLTLTQGTPYNNKEKTARISQIAFICDPNIGKGSPEFDGERDRSYFFRWYTTLACPQPPKIVHCVWDNGSHILDLTQLSITTGNHFTVSPTSPNTVPAIYYLNICRPLNPIYNKDLKDCGANSAACRVEMGEKRSVLSLGEATHPPITAFDGSVSLFYENGGPCPSNKSKKISTRIKFECEPYADFMNPTVYEPGSELTDKEECVYLFDWKTSAVCDVIEPTKLNDNSCAYTDSRTGLTVDLSSLKRRPNQELYKVFQNHNQSTIELNVCGLANSRTDPECRLSAVCLMPNKNQSVVNYGLLTESAFFYDGINLRLKYFNGSKCSAHSDTGTMSSEIIFKCNRSATNSKPKLHAIHGCIAVFEWETNLVCGLELPKCSTIADKKYYNLHQLSSISHAWNTTDSNGTIYLLNVCTKLNPSIGCKGQNAAACKCKYDAKNNLNCSKGLGDPSVDELTVSPNGNLLMTYRNGDEDECERNSGKRANTQITFICSHSIGSPKFIGFDRTNCSYNFEWKSLMACAVNSTDDVVIAQDSGYLHDHRLDVYIDIRPLLSQTFNVVEERKENNETDSYIYVINLSKAQLNDSKECSKAAVCQTKGKAFQRDIGTIETIQYHLRGHELQIVVHSLSAQKCGKNSNKNVTTIFRLQCSKFSKQGKPVFMYESNNCDYTFEWETELVCPNRFLTRTEFEQIPKSATNDAIEESSDSTKAKSSHSNVWIGILIVVFFVVTLTVLLVYKQRVRQSLMFRFRRLFGPETTNHTFHYHQLASNEKDRQTEVVFITNGTDAHNRNTIAAQPSGHVPYYSIYDDSDVDLLT